MYKIIKIMLLMLIVFLIFKLVTLNKDHILRTYEECSEIHSNVEAIQRCAN